MDPLSHLDDPTLNEYLDGALAPAQRSDIDAHLAACAECAARLSDLRALFATLDALPEEPLARDLTANVLAQLPTRPHIVARAALRLVFAAQALLTLVLLAVAAPLVTAGLTGLEPASFSQPLSGFAAELLNSLMGAWASLQAAAQNLWSQSVAWLWQFSAPAGVSAPMLMWGLLLAAIALLWAFGNGVLLRSAFASRRRS
jgi:anti-sigma factor RsiW